MEHWINLKLREDNIEFILCSSSPRRKEILKQLGIEAIIKPSKFEEDLNKERFKEDIIEYVRLTSNEKLKDVVNSEVKDINKRQIFLSADTVIICDEKIYEKPGNFENNIIMLKELRDKQLKGFSVKIVTCCSMYYNKLGNEEEEEVSGERYILFEKVSEIKFINKLSDEDIYEYVKSGEGIDAAGGFKIQGFGMILIESIKGDFFNCVGLPGGLVFEKIGELIGK